MAQTIPHPAQRERTRWEVFDVSSNLIRLWLTQYDRGELNA
jgi:hypothetical protein